MGAQTRKRPVSGSTLGFPLLMMVAVLIFGGVERVEAADRPAKYLFGVVPQQSASRLAQVWIPLLKQISLELGVEVSFATAKDIPTFETCLARGAYAFAYMNPYHYTVFSETAGYRAFARQSEKKLQGLLVVRKDSNLQELADLNGQPVAFPSPAAFGASVLPRAEMRAGNIDHKPVYVKSHDSVYRAVAAGLFPAGGGVRRTFGNIPDALRQKLRIIYTTGRYTPHAFAGHSSVPKPLVAKLAGALVRIGETRPNLIKPLGFKGFEHGQDADWDDVRALELDRKTTSISSGAGSQEGRLACHSG